MMSILPFTIGLGLLNTYASADLERVSKVLAQLRQGEGYHSALTKKVHEGVLERDTVSTGEIYLAKGKMRLEFTKPEKLLMVFDGDHAWQEQEFDGQAVVT